MTVTAWATKNKSCCLIFKCEGSSYLFCFMLIFFKFSFIFYKFYLHVCMFTRRMPDAHEGQKRALGHVELGLQTAVSHHMGSGN